jgi:NitT/TauT family transport system permease protein
MSVHGTTVDGSGASVQVREGSDRVQRRFINTRTMERFLALSSPLVLLAVWELLVRVGVLDFRFFPAPTSIRDTFGKLIASGELASFVGVSLSRVLLGFLIGAVPALVLGIVMGLQPLVRAAVQPIVGAIFPIPKVAILPLVMLIFGLGEQSKWAIIAIGVFFQVLISTAAGVANIDRVYLEVGTAFGASRLNVYRTVALPGALPVIFAGVRLGWGISLLLLVTAEMVASRSGLGFLIWQSWQTFQVEEMYVGLIVIAAIGILSFVILDALEGWLMPWKPRRQ